MGKQEAAYEFNNHFILLIVDSSVLPGEQRVTKTGQVGGGLHDVVHVRVAVDEAVVQQGLHLNYCNMLDTFVM